MTVDWTKFRDGDEFTVTFQGRLNHYGKLVVDSPHGIDSCCLKLATSAELITPEIVTGAAYVDADGKAYLGGTEAGTVVGTAPGSDALTAFGNYPSRPLPAGLRRAKVVPE